MRLSFFSLFCLVCVCWAETNHTKNHLDFLPELSIDRSGITTGGISAGGYFATQFHFAFSSLVGGSAAFASGPYFCAEGDVTKAFTQCMYNYLGVDVNKLIRLTEEKASKGLIDPLENLKHSRAYVYSGTQDTTVAPAVAK